MAITNTQADYFADILIAIRGAQKVKDALPDAAETMDKASLIQYVTGNEANLKKLFSDERIKEAAMSSFGADAEKKVEFETNMREVGLDPSVTSPTTDPDKSNFDLSKAGLPAAIAFAAGLIFTKNLKTAGQWALYAGGGGLALGNMDEIGKTFAPLLEGLGEGGKGLLDVFSGGAEGIGGILGSIGGALGGLKDNPVLGGLVDKFKENPLTAIALVVAMGMGWNKGNGVFGSMFEMGKYALIALAATWVAEHYLGIGGQQRGNEIPDRTPSQLADQRVPAGLQVDS